MEMSDDSITSIEQQGPPPDWGVNMQGSNLAPPVVMLAPQQRSNGGGSPSENGEFLSRLAGRTKTKTILISGHGGAEEISVFNGDENHKVWAAKELDMTDGIYGDYGSTMRSFRSSASGLSTRARPRQMMMQSPPPPPIPEELVIKETGKEEREKKKKKKSKSREPAAGHDQVDHMMPPLLNGSQSNLGPPSNGSVINGGRASSVLGGRKMSAGSFIGINNPPGRPNMNGGPRGGGGGGGGGGPPMGPPMYGPPPPGGFGPPGPPPPMMMMPGRGGGKKGGTFSGRQKGMRAMPPLMMFGGPAGGPMMPPGPLPPHLMPPPGHPLYGAMAGGRPESQVMEEPIYMPHSARPLSPVASYQPGHFPHDAYYSQQQYATIDKNGKYHHRHNRDRKHKSNGKHSKHHQSSAESNAEDSEGTGNGIYKKGYINERAFAHSMRNEHRSRSYGSLANLPLDPTGDVILSPEDEGSPQMLDDRKKGRDMMQMMDNLDLDDDHIERSEVPAGFYPPPRQYRGLPPPHPGQPQHANGVGGGHGRRHRR